MNALVAFRFCLIAARAAALQLSLAACALSAPGYPQQKNTDVPFVTIDRGYNSGVTERKFLAIKTANEWQSLWHAHESIRVPPRPVPAVDFEKEMIVAVFSGERPSGGHGIEILRIEEDANKRELRVSFRETQPPAGAMVTAALTQPYHVVKLKKVDFPATFVPQP